MNTDFSAFLFSIRDYMGNLFFTDFVYYFVFLFIVVVNLVYIMIIVYLF